MKVKMDHMRRLGYCARGVREFFSHHGLDYSKFLEEGIDSEELLRVGGDNQMVLDVVEVANGQQ